MEERVLVPNIQYYITNMFSYVKKRKPHSPWQVPLGTIRMLQTLEIINIKICARRYQCLVVVTYDFTRFIQKYVTQNKSVKTAIEKALHILFFDLTYPHMFFLEND